MTRRIIEVLLAFLLAGTGHAASDPFAGTTWKLLSIQSMDESQGTTRPKDPNLFTLNFGKDGRAAFKLDCNRGAGDYKAVQAGDGATGSFRFGPIAGTRALCAPPRLDERVLRDMAYVRGYRLLDGKLYLTLMADGAIYEWEPVHHAGTASDKDRSVKPIQFARGASSAVIRGRIAGRQYVDHLVQAFAGQRMTVNLASNNSANSFNLLPPDSLNAAMAIGDLNGNRFEGLLPDDGKYTVRVFLQRAAGRRNETSDYTLTVGITGAALKPVTGAVDAKLPGTRFHARTITACEPLYSKARECEAYVVRRGFDGTATVELRWQSEGQQEMKRRILFIKGEPRASDVPQPLSFTRTERGWRLSFNGEEHFEIPEALVNGG